LFRTLDLPFTLGECRGDVFDTLNEFKPRRFSAGPNELVGPREKHGDDGRLARPEQLAATRTGIGIEFAVSAGEQTPCNAELSS